MIFRPRLFSIIIKDVNFQESVRFFDNEFDRGISTSTIDNVPDYKHEIIFFTKGRGGNSRQLATTRILLSEAKDGVKIECFPNLTWFFFLGCVFGALLSLFLLPFILFNIYLIPISSRKKQLIIYHQL